MATGATYKIVVPAGSSDLGLILGGAYDKEGVVVPEIRRIDHHGRAMMCNITLQSRIVCINSDDVSNKNKADLEHLLSSQQGRETTLILKPPEAWKPFQVLDQKNGFFKGLGAWIKTGPNRASKGIKAASVRRVSWNTKLFATINLLKAGAYAVPREVKAIRLITDHAIPRVALPKGVHLIAKSGLGHSPLQLPPSTFSHLLIHC